MMAELREKLGSSQDEKGFAALLSFLNGNDDHSDYEVALDYAGQHLEGWPSEARVTQFPVCFSRYRSWFERPSLRLLRGAFAEDGSVSTEGLKAIVQCPHLCNLEVLHIQNNWFGDGGITALANSPYMANLKYLDVGYNYVGNDGLEAIAGSKYMGRLEKLVLTSNSFGRVGLMALAKSSRLPNLKMLDLGAYEPFDDFDSTIKANPHMAKLEHVLHTYYRDQSDVRAMHGRSDLKEPVA